MLKAGGQLGLSIVGGVDHSSHPFGATDPGVYISKVHFLFRYLTSFVMGFSLNRIYVFSLMV